MSRRTAPVRVVVAFVLALGAFFILSLFSSPAVLAHTCGVTPLNLRTGETGSYTIGAGGVSTNYEVINDGADVASITPGGSFTALDGVFSITARKMGVTLILIFWEAPDLDESDLCLLDVRVLDPTTTPTPTSTPTATPTSTPTPTATPTPTPTATATPTPTLTPTPAPTSTPTPTPPPGPRPCPTAAEMLANATVSAAIEQAWTDSQAGDRVRRHEEGGWIIMNIISGALRVERWPVGAGSGIAPNPAGLGANEALCGEFHTHPNPPVDESGNRWEQGPSGADIRAANAEGDPGIIRHGGGTETYGPNRAS